MIAPLAYFLTWTTYGTRLHGDPRGTVDLEHNQVGRPFLPTDQTRERQMRASLVDTPFRLTPRTQQAVQEVIRRHVEHRGWRLHALATPFTHVHVVLDCRRPDEPTPMTPEKVMRELKSWGTRELRDLGLIDKTRRVWTDHGSTRWINSDNGLHAAIDYVTRLQ